MTTKIDVSELKALGKALHKTAPAVEREFNKGLLAYGVLVAESAKGKAGFSTRIPQTIKARRRARSVRVTAGGSTAPHAAALENKGKQGLFRHPVFRTVFNMDTWVTQPAHPFLGPAAEENFDKGVAIILHEVDQAFMKSGFEMPQGEAKVILTGENARAIKAINEVGTASEKAAAKSSSAFDKSTSKVGGAFQKLDRTLGSFGVPFTGALGVMGTKLEDTGKRSKGLKDNLSALGGGIALGAAAGFALIGGAAVKAALAGEKAHAQLVVAIKNAGQTEEQFGGKIDATSKHMADFGFQNDEVETSIARLTSVTKDTGKAIELQGLAANIAAARHISLEEATSILVKVESGHVGLLGRLGIATKDATGKTISQQEAEQKLASLYKGAAAAAADTYAGKIAALSAKTQNLVEELGNKLIPIIEKGVTGILGTVDAFDSANKATGGWLGKIALAGTAVPVAVFAIDKLAKGGKAVVDAYGKVGSAIGSAVSGIKGATTASEGLVVATDASAASYAGLTTAQAASAVADAELVIARGAESAAAAAATTANVQLGLALAAVQIAEEGDAAAAANLVGAKTAAAAANLRLAAAAEAAAVAETEAVAAAGGEEAATGLVALTGITGPAIAGVAALTAGVYILGRTLPSSTEEAKHLAEGLAGMGDEANKAQAQLAKIVGGPAAADLKDYSNAIIANASAQELATIKAAALSHTTQTLVNSQDSALTAIKANADAQFTGAAAAQGYSAATTAQQVAIGKATDALDDLKTKYGEAAVQNATLSAAQKAYADLLASGTAKEQDLAAAREAVVSASEKSAKTQNAVTTATEEGTNAADDNTGATKEQADATKALADELNGLYDAENSVLGSQLSFKESVFAVSKAVADNTEKTLIAIKAKGKDKKANDDVTESGFALSHSILTVGQNASKAAQDAETLRQKQLGVTDASLVAKAGIDAEVSALRALERQFPALKPEIESYIATLKKTPTHVTTELQVRGYEDAVTKLRTVANLIGSGTQTSVITFGGGGGGQYRARQHGGPVSAGSPYVVGEKGPELFIPKTSGTVVPNGAAPKKYGTSGGDTYLTINASGIGDRELGRQVVQALREYQRTRGPLNLKIAG